MDIKYEKSSPWLNRTVGGVGLTSALGDFCYETTSVILPGFLAVLGLPAAILGIIEGIADAVASFTKMGAGFIADKLGYRKVLVLVGYGLTPLGQMLIALSVGWPLILLGRIVSWFGKGLRGPLRDAIVAQAISPETRGRAFGFHRAMDTVGAVAGPLLGVALLGWAQTLHFSDPSRPFRIVFWLTLIPGGLAVLVFLTLVKDPVHTPNPALKFFGALRVLPSQFKRYLGAVGLFGIGDFSHTLLILAATQILTPSLGIIKAAQMAGLFYVLRNIVQVATSYPVGVLSDRYGSMPVLVVGYLLGTVTAILTMLAFWLSVDSIVYLGGIFLIAGLYMAVQEALEASVTADLVSPNNLGTSYGALGMVNGVSIADDRPLAEAVDLMLSKDVKRLPVVDSSGSLIGMLSRLDIFRTVMREAPDWKTFSAQKIEVKHLKCIGEILRRDTHAVSPETSIDKVIQVIDDNDIQRVVVVNPEGKLLGLISDRDLLHYFRQEQKGIWHMLSKVKHAFAEEACKSNLGKCLAETTAAAVMNTKVITVSEDMLIEEAIGLMTEKALKRLPVVDESGRFKGMVSRDSLLRTGFGSSEVKDL